MQKSGPGSDAIDETIATGIRSNTAVATEPADVFDPNESNNQQTADTDIEKTLAPVPAASGTAPAILLLALCSVTAVSLQRRAWRRRTPSISSPCRIPPMGMSFLARVLVCLFVLLAPAVRPAAAAPVCAGDCNGGGDVSVDELIRGVNIALGSAPLSACPVFDADADGSLAINELVAAVSNALGGCAGNQPTRTAVPTPTATPDAGETPGPCSNGTASATFTAVEPTNANLSPASFDGLQAAQTYLSMFNLYSWGITGTMCSPDGSGQVRGFNLVLIGQAKPFTAGTYPLSSPFGSVTYTETPAVGIPQPRIWQANAGNLVIESVSDGSLRFRIESGEMAPNTIVAGNPKPTGKITMNVSGTVKRILTISQ